MNGYEIIESKKAELAKKYSSLVEEKYPIRTVEIEKCSRDILLVIDSYIDVLRYNSETRRESLFNTTDLIGHRFFGPNYKHLKGDVSVEIEVHKRLYQDLHALLDGHTTDQRILKECADSLLNKFENSIEEYEENDIVKLLKGRYQCRAFSKRPVELEKVQVLLDALDLVPAKQCVHPERVDVLGPKALVDKEFIYSDTICTLNPSCMNPQIFAPLTFVFSERTEFDELTETQKAQVPELDPSKSTYEKNRLLTIGMTLSILMLTARSLGLECGYCAAVGPGRYSIEMLKQQKMIDFVFGVGYPREDYSSPRTRLEPDKPTDQHQGIIIKSSEPYRSRFSDYVHLRGF